MGQFLRYLLDGLAGASLGVAVAFALTGLFQLPLLVAASLGALVFVRVFASLVRLTPVAALPLFVPAALDFAEEDELLLDQPIAGDWASARVVGLFGPAKTPGELHQAIERHLHGRVQDRPDATEELRDALAKLRRSVG